MATRYERIYEDLKQDLQYIVEEYYSGNLSSAFGHFFLKMKFGLSNDEAYECMTDGFNDNGIDAIYTENNKTVHFFQFKFPEEKSGISRGIKEDEVLKLTNGFENFVAPKDEFSKLTWNDLLLEKREEYEKNDIYDYKLWIVRFSNQKVNEKIINKMENFLCKYSQSTGNTIENNFLGADSCVTLYENNIKNIWPDFKLKYKKTLSPFSDEKSIINSAFVPLIDIYDTFYLIRDKIYEGNVRYLNPNSKINDGIKNTILNNYQNFHLLNNGITIICKACNDNTAQGYLDIKNGTIINGAQTVGTIINTLHNMDSEKRKEYSDSFVFVRIVSLNGDEQITNDMVYTLNTQNQMKSSYIISNDAIVKNVQDRINNETEFFLEVKNNEFNFEKERNKEFNKLAKNSIDIETFIQVYVAFYNIANLANLAKNNKANLFESSNVQKIINELDYEKSVRAYRIYLKLMDIIKDYRAYRKNQDKTDILEILDIKPEEISDFKFLNTGNIIIMYALGLAYLNKCIDPSENMINIIKYLKSFFKGENNISNATKIKESFDAVKELMENYKS